MSDFLQKYFLSKIDGLKTINDINITSNKNFFTVINTNNGIQFLFDVIKNIISVDVFKSEIATFIKNNLIPYNKKLLNQLKNTFISHFDCNYNFVINNILIEQGVDVPISLIDVFDNLKINENDDNFKNYYINNNDLNYILHKIIKNNEINTNWNNIFIISYKNSSVFNGILYSDVINIKIHENYNNKTIIQLITDIFNNINLFNFRIINTLNFDNLFGNFFNKKDIKNKEYYKIFINKILEKNNSTDNNYYDFNQIEINNLFNNQKKFLNNNYIYKSCKNKRGIIDINIINNINEFNENDINFIENINNGLNLAFSETIENLTNKEKRNGINEIYENYFKNIINSLSQIIASPKILILLHFFNKIYNQLYNYNEQTDIFSKNNKFFEKIILSYISEFIIDYLKKLLIQNLQSIINSNKNKKNIEQLRYYQLQTSSLLGLNI